MRILALSSWWPEPADNGSRMRIAHLLDTLAQEHEVHLVAFAESAAATLQSASLERICTSVRAVPQRGAKLRPADRVVSLWRAEPASVRVWWSPAFAAHVEQRAQAVRPDVVIAFQLGVAPYACKVSGAPRVLEELELAVMREQFTGQRWGWPRLRAWLTWAKHRRYVGRLLRSFAACTVTSERELLLARQLIPPATTLAVVPNGADVLGSAGAWGEPEPDSLIYPGALSYSANLDAMAYFLRAIFPQVRAVRPGARLRITGKATHEQRAALPTVDGVELTGYLPDVRPLVARSWCEVVPLRVGGGTRLKVLEALALGTPVVATSKGIEGLELEPGRHVLVADTADAFAEATARLLADPEARSRLGAAGRQRVAERYDWRAIGSALNDCIAETVDRWRVSRRLEAH